MILALDLGTRLGWARSDGTHGVINLRPSKHTDSPGMRQVLFRRALSDLAVDFEQTRSLVKLIAYEAVSFHAAGSRAAHVYGALQGRLHEFCEDHKVECVGVKVTELKKWATGKGNASKGMMIARANELRRCGVAPITDDNEADAVCLLAFAHERYLPKCEP